MTSSRESNIINYYYEQGKVVRATEADITFTSESYDTIASTKIVFTQYYTYDSNSKLTAKKTVYPDGTERTVYHESPEKGDAVVKFEAGGKTVTSHSKTDHFGRKIFDELQLGTGFVSRQFSYHAGEVTAEHSTSGKLKSSATTQLVSQIVLSDGKTLSYNYDDEERITSVVETYNNANGVPVTNTTTYTYDALGQLLTETVNGVTKNAMTYDNYGNIKSKNGKSYTYDSTWKDLLESYDGQSISYDEQGNPTSYRGNSLTWEKGRQLKQWVKPADANGLIDTLFYTYNGSGIRTMKQIGLNTAHKYTLDGTKIISDEILNLTDGTDYSRVSLEPVYDNQDSICGIIHCSYEENSSNELQWTKTPYYFLKNLQGDVIGITDKDGSPIARYTYDAWGVCTITSDTSNCGIATINPFRYRGYYYDTETGLYYLQSRYYNPEVGRFINADEVDVIQGKQSIIYLNLFSYCGNDSINRLDYNGCSWYQNYSGFKKTSLGFDVLVNIDFLSRKFCLSYADDFLNANGTWHWYGRTYSGMGRLRIAQELWFHALAFYIGIPLQAILKMVGISCNWINDKVTSAYKMEIDSDDNRAWVFSAVWWAGSPIYSIIKTIKETPYYIIKGISL